MPIYEYLTSNVTYIHFLKVALIPIFGPKSGASNNLGPLGFALRQQKR